MAGLRTNSTTIALPTEMQSKIIQKVQEDSVVMKLAQKIDLPGVGATIPVILGDPEAAWVAETSEKPVSDPNLGVKTMGAYTIAVIVPFSNQFRNNMPALYSAIVERLPKALSKTFDKTVFGSINAPGSNFDTLKTVTAQAFGSNPYAALVAAKKDIADHDGITTGYAISPAGESALLNAVDGNGRPLFLNSAAEGAVPMILGAPTHQSKAAAPALGFVGDWTQAMYGINGGVEISISGQASLKIGDEQINLWQRNMFAVRAEIEVGFVADTTVFNKFTA